MFQKISTLFIHESKAGIVYFVALIGVLVAFWIFLVTSAILVQQDVAESYTMTDSVPGVE